jgi:hypothetical protein
VDSRGMQRRQKGMQLHFETDKLLASPKSVENFSKIMNYTGNEGKIEFWNFF